MSTKSLCDQLGDIKPFQEHLTRETLSTSPGGEYLDKKVSMSSAGSSRGLLRSASDNHSNVSVEKSSKSRPYVRSGSVGGLRFGCSTWNFFEIVASMILVSGLNSCSGSFSNTTGLSNSKQNVLN